MYNKFTELLEKYRRSGKYEDKINQFIKDEVNSRVKTNMQTMFDNIKNPPVETQPSLVPVEEPTNQ